MGEITSNKLDQLDHKILTALLKDGRAPLLHIARDAKTSPETVKQRIIALQHRNIIRAFTTSINYPALGMDIYKAFIYTRGMTAQEEQQLIAWLSEQSQLRNWVRLAGPWKIEAEFLCQNHEQLYELISCMRQAFPKVSRVSYAVFKNEVYYPSGEVLRYEE
jgi:DNA-binding Lrp family transcriptional regulator